MVSTLLRRSGLAVLALLLAAGPAPAQTAVEQARDEGAFVAALGDLYAGDADAAARTLETLLDTRPDDAAVLDALAEAYTLLDRSADALYHAGLAADATDRPEPRLRLAALQTARGDLAAAAASYETAIPDAPTDPEPLIALGELYARLGRPADERRTLLRILDFGDTAAARLRLATLAIDAGDPGDAAQHLAVAVALQPREPALWRRLAEARSAAGDAAGAADARTQADRLDPTIRPATPTAASDDALTADDALAQLDALLDRAEADPAVLPDALALAERALDLAPRRGDLLAAAGDVAARAGDNALAADRLVAAVEADPRLLDAWALGLVVLARSGDTRAADHADEATLLFGSVPEIVGAAALAYASAGRLDDARVSARMALPGLDPSHPLYARIAPLSQ